MLLLSARQSLFLAKTRKIHLYLAPTLYSSYQLASFSLSFHIYHSDSTSVQSSVSIPIPDRPTGRAQVTSARCSEWEVAKIPHWSGRSCLILNVTFFSVIQLLSPGPSLQHPGELEKPVVLRRGPHCPSPSTFASAEHSIYFIAPLHLIALTSQIPLRVMRWLRWCESQCWLARLTTQWGSSGERPCSKEKKR